MSSLRMTAEQAQAHQKRVRRGVAAAVPKAAAAAPAGAFKNKVDGFRMARKWWVCRACTTAYSTKRTTCCPDANVQYCASGREAERLRELLLLERAGGIRNLRCQPRYECVVQGIRICTYVADFAYEASGPVDYGSVVEDVKGNPRYQDSASALRRRLAEVLHAIVVRLV